MHTGDAGRTRKPEQRTATVNLPFVTAQFRAPDLHMPNVHLPLPDRRDVDALVRTVRGYLPSPQKTAYYLGLGLMAVIEVIEWPVAAAIGIGTALAGSAQRHSERSSARQGSQSARLAH